MSELRSAFDELRLTDVVRLGDTELEEDLVEIERVSRALEAERARRIAEVDRRGTFARDGHLSTTSWLIARLGVTPASAVQQVRLARAIERMPRTRAALEDGRISGAAAFLLVAAAEADPDAFADGEPTLVDAAERLGIRELRLVVERWKQLADADTADELDARRFGRRALHVSPTLDGMVRVDGDLDPETGQTVITALRSLQDSWSRSDDEDRRTPAQRRADALGEICRRYLDRSDRPLVAGERPHLVVTIDADALMRRAGGLATLDEAGPVGRDTARRLACDASVSRVVTQGCSEPLDVGRRTPVVPPALRRAVVVRDRTCRFPGCDRPHSWCDAHHLVHWADGGTTSLSNLVLLCRRHHRLVHGSFDVESVDGRPVFRRPDGSPLRSTGPP